MPLSIYEEAEDTKSAFSIVSLSPATEIWQQKGNSHVCFIQAMFRAAVEEKISWFCFFFIPSNIHQWKLLWTLGVWDLINISGKVDNYSPSAKKMLAKYRWLIDTSTVRKTFNHRNDQPAEARHCMQVNYYFLAVRKVWFICIGLRNSPARFIGIRSLQMYQRVIGEPFLTLKNRKGQLVAFPSCWI